MGCIELDVDNLQADINLNAQVTGLVSINADVALSVQKINLTIVDAEAELELIVRLGKLVEIVNRVFESLDLNPLLITALNPLIPFGCDGWAVGFYHAGWANTILPD